MFQNKLFVKFETKHYLVRSRLINERGFQHVSVSRPVTIIAGQDKIKNVGGQKVSAGLLLGRKQQ